MKENISLVVIPCNKLGGAENVLGLIGKHLSLSTNVKFIILSKKERKSWLSSDYDIIQMKNKKEVIGYIKLLFLLLMLKRKYKISSVYSSFVRTNGVLGLYRKFGILKCDNLILRESTNIFERFSGLKLLQFKMFYALGYSKCDVLICQTKHMYNQLIDNLKISSEWNVRVLGNPVDTEKARCLAEFEDKQLLELNDYIFTLGRLIKVKGHRNLIDAFSLLSKTYPRMNLVIGGAGPEKENLLNQIESLKLKDKVHLIGHLNNPYPWYKNASLNVISSINEGFPNVLLEMMSVGDRCISTTCTDEIYNVPGIIHCESENSKALTDIMKESLEQSSKMKQQQINIMRNYVQEKDIGVYCSKIEGYLN